MTQAASSALTTRLGAFARKCVQAFRNARNGNVALIFSVAIIPVMVTGAAGIDLARTLAVRSKMYAAVDAAALAVASKYSNAAMTDEQADTLAEEYFRANYKLDASFGNPNTANATVDAAARKVVVSTSTQVPTTLMNIAGIQYVTLNATSNVVWGQTKVWVGLALDTTGSMAQGDANGTKIAALKTAVAGANGLFDKLAASAATAGDVQLAMIPFSKGVNVTNLNPSSATWLDWTSWDETHGSCVLNGASMTGNAYDTKSECEGATSGVCSAGSGFTTQNMCNNAGTCTISGHYTQSNCQAATVGTCSISGNNSKNSCESDYVNVCSISGYTTKTSCQNAFVNACSLPGYTTQSSCQNAALCSNPAKTTQNSCTNQKACSNGAYTSKNPCQNAGHDWDYGTWMTGSWNKVYGVWSKSYGVWSTTNGVWTSAPGVWTIHTGVWTADRTGWNNCVADRGLDAGPANAGGTVSSTTAGFDTNVDAPGASSQSKFKVQNVSGCPATIRPLGFAWSDLKTAVNNLSTGGSTNQPIGLVWAWHAMTNAAPINAGAVPANTTRYIIIVSDGENTADRWYGNGSDHSDDVDKRMTLVCNAAKADGVIIYSLFVNIAGTAGNADSMKQCATGGATGGKYYEVSGTGAIGTALDAIAAQITNLRVAQ